MPVDLPTMNSTTINLTYLPITQNLRGGGRYSLKWLTQGCATGQGMVFWPLCPKQGVYFVICPKHGPKIKGVPLNRVGILGFFFLLSRVRVSNPQRQPYTQTWVKCPPPSPRAQNILIEKRKKFMLINCYYNKKSSFDSTVLHVINHVDLSASYLQRGLLKTSFILRVLVVKKKGKE